MLLRHRIDILSALPRAKINSSLSAPSISLGVLNALLSNEININKERMITKKMNGNDSIGLRIHLGVGLEQLRQSLAGSFREMVEKLFEPIVFALPKKRTSHKVKRLRNGHKQLRNIKHFQTCPKCQGRHLLHHLCPWCFPFNQFLAKKGDLKPKNLA